MITVVNGMHRSGSTYIFNIVKGIYSHSYSQFGFTSIGAKYVNEYILRTIEDRDNLREDRALLFKTHNYIPHSQSAYQTANMRYPGMARSIFTYRNPLDILASLMLLPVNRQPAAQHIDPITEECTEFMHIRFKGECLMLKYEEFKDDPSIVRTVADHLGLLTHLEPDHKVFREIFDSLSIDKMKAISDSVVLGKIDQGTELRSGHISEYKGVPGYWREVLPIEDARALYARVAGYMTEMGYINTDL